MFYDQLDELLDLVSQQLLDRFEIQAEKKVYNFPFLMGQGVWLDSEKLDSNDSIREVLKHGTLSIGFIGLAETLTALYGKHHGEDPDIQQKGLAIIRHMREFCDRKSQDLKMNFSLLATPAEGLAGRFVKLDRERYGSIPGVYQYGIRSRRQRRFRLKHLIMHCAMRAISATWSLTAIRQRM